MEICLDNLTINTLKYCAIIPILLIINHLMMLTKVNFTVIDSWKFADTNIWIIPQLNNSINEINNNTMIEHNQNNYLPIPVSTRINNSYMELLHFSYQYCVPPIYDDGLLFSNNTIIYYDNSLNYSIIYNATTIQSSSETIHSLPYHSAMLAILTIIYIMIRLENKEMELWKLIDNNNDNNENQSNVEISTL